MKILILCLVVTVRFLKRVLGLRRPDYVAEKYDNEKQIQYVSCIGKIKPVGKFTRLHQLLDLY